MRMTWRNYVVGALIPVLILSGCSLLAEEKKKESPDKKKPFQVATTVEGMVKEGPGKFAGDQYNEEKLSQEPMG
ncbi:hypothetical protein [Paludifilum halophilum]|uniref:Uncharacterized protein n=1 Tax=Paludifilum halophilum TaxID=1642702 RepID=A0A235B480_9BACL|nr:hypothetical protein [Paludifilum halophilum]OYD06717.1 hypothetical protein CHM34_14145 [Paludifilum halophilum]